MTLMLLFGAFVYAFFERSIGEALLLLATFLFSLFFAEKGIIYMRRQAWRRNEFSSRPWLTGLVSLHLVQLLIWSPVLTLWPSSAGLDFEWLALLLLFCVIGLPSVSLWWVLRRFWGSPDRSRDMKEWFSNWKMRDIACDSSKKRPATPRTLQNWDVPGSMPITIDFCGLDYEDCTITIPTRDAEFVGWRFERMRQGDTWCLAGITFENCHFRDCDFWATCFEECHFVGCTFVESRFFNVSFLQCSFEDTKFLQSRIATGFVGLNEDAIVAMIDNGALEILVERSSLQNGVERIEVHSPAIETKWYEDYGTIRSIAAAERVTRCDAE